MDLQGDGVTVERPPTSGPAVRASDAERAAVAERLHAALVEGRLDVAETQERLALVDAARYRADLEPLLADLPVPATAEPGGGWPRVWRTVVDQAWMSSAPLRGERPAPPDPRQRRATTVVLSAAAVWVMALLLVGFAVGLLG